MSSDDSSSDMEDWFLINSNGDVISRRDLVADFKSHNQAKSVAEPLQMEAIAESSSKTEATVTETEIERSESNLKIDSENCSSFATNPKVEEVIAEESCVKLETSTEIKKEVLDEEPTVEMDHPPIEVEVENPPIEVEEPVVEMESSVFGIMPPSTEARNSLKDLMMGTEKLLMETRLPDEPVCQFEKLLVELKKPLMGLGDPIIHIDLPLLRVEEPETGVVQPSSEIRNSLKELVSQAEKLALGMKLPDQPVSMFEKLLVEMKKPLMDIDEPISRVEEPEMEIEEPMIGIEPPSIEMENLLIDVKQQVIEIEQPLIEKLLVELEEPLIKVEEPVIQSEEPIIKVEKPVSKTEKSKKDTMPMVEVDIDIGIGENDTKDAFNWTLKAPVKISNQMPSGSVTQLKRTISKSKEPESNKTEFARETVIKKVTTRKDLSTKVKAKKAKLKEMPIKVVPTKTIPSEVKLENAATEVKKQIVNVTVTKTTPHLGGSDANLSSQSKIVKHRTNSDSSSDISLIDEDATEVVQLTKHAANVSTGVVPVFRQKQLHTTDAETQTIRKSSTRRRPLYYNPSDYSMYSPEAQAKRNQGFQELICVFAFIIISGTCIIHILHSFRPPQGLTTIDRLNIIQTNVFDCLGQQQTHSLQYNSTRKRLYVVCRHDMEYHREEVEKHFADNKVQSFFFTAQGLIHENKSEAIPALIKGNISHLNIELLIHQLEYYLLLPRMFKNPEFLDLVEDNPIESYIPVQQFNTMIKNLTVLNEQLRDTISMSEMQHKATRDERATNTEGDTLAIDQKLLDLVENVMTNKLEMFNIQNNELRLDIQNMEKDHMEQLLGVLEIDEELGDKSLNLQLELAKSLQENTLEEVKNLYKFVMNWYALTHNETTFFGDQWTLENLKESLKGYINEAQKDIREIVEEYRKQAADIFDSFSEDKKAQAETVVNYVSDYIKMAKEETENMINDKMPESFMNGMWNMWGEMKKKWSEVKEELKDVTGIRKSKSKSQKHDDKKMFCSEKDHKKEACGKKSNEWFFKRASLREEKRNDKNMMNWYLAREKLREKQRKQNNKH